MKILTEKQLIVNQFIVENKDDDKEYILDKVKQYFDKYVLDNDYNYFIGLCKSCNDEIKDYTLFYTAKTVDDIVEILQTEYKKETIYCIQDILANDEERCEKLGITYHDDSDYDREYGYGQAGNYDEDELLEKAEEIYDDAEEDLINNIKADLDKILEDPRKYTAKLNNNIFTTILGWSEVIYTYYEIVFGITNYKK